MSTLQRIGIYVIDKLLVVPTPKNCNTCNAFFILERRCSRIKDPGKWLEKVIKDFINKSPENTLYEDKFEKAFADPIVGFSGGNDPLYQFFKEDIGDFYLTFIHLMCYS